MDYLFPNLIAIDVKIVASNVFLFTFYIIPKGVTTFYVNDQDDMVVTGGPDTSIRIWDIYVPTHAAGLLTGHNSGIVKVFVQAEEKKIFSIDYLKIIKVWDLSDHTLVQTFDDLIRIIPSENDLVFHYHKALRILLIGCRKLVAIKCNPRVRVDLSDGTSHAGPVSVVLYNKLFRSVVTCGLDSYVIVWDPWSGRRKIIIRDCHTERLYGETQNVEITAACFDPLEGYLLTGARDGTLKIWNYNNAVCIRNLRIAGDHKVTAVRWVVERILVVGWDQQVTEFPYQEGHEFTLAKKWPMFHHDDITCADLKLGEGVVTASYSGELILWKLETGQPYRCYNVAEPEEYIELQFNKYKEKRKEIFPVTEPHLPTSKSMNQFVRHSVFEMGKQMIKSFSTNKQHHLVEKVRRTSEHVFVVMSVQTVLFLQTRRFSEDHGNYNSIMFSNELGSVQFASGDLLVALETGAVQIYSHHQRGGFMAQFNAIHKMGDCVLTMTADRKERYLFTGTAFGYVKIWHIQNLAVPPSEKVRINMPLLRLQFIFLRKDTFLLSAKRAVRYQKEPLLLSSYKAHLKAITSMIFINLPKILITGSHDWSVRVWTIGGRYLGTLGTPLPWMKLSPFEPIKEEGRVFRLCPDIKKVASSTTMKVTSGAQPDRIRPRLEKVVEEKELEEENELMRRFNRAREPILGKHFSLPAQSKLKHPVKLKMSSSPDSSKFTPIYTHLNVYEVHPLELPSTSPAMKNLASETYVSYGPTICSSLPFDNKSPYLLSQEPRLSTTPQEETESDSSYDENI
uniref:WD repeat-containing protein on Y chromosome n=1 Tax=Glossina brevipalpis TaxID=37001 RepID=A0A1A9WKU6_9MUSC